jgi:hypothetical protein
MDFYFKNTILTLLIQILFFFHALDLASFFLEGVEVGGVDFSAFACAQRP